VFEKEVEIRSGTTAGDALAQVAEIGMSGSYIETINGIKGDQREYWLYYINGILANVFAHGYKMQPGDVMHWDFHDWRFYMHNPMAIAGYFPEPSIHGYNGETAPTVVVYGDGFRETAERLGRKLAALGVGAPAVKAAGDLSRGEKEKNNIFIVAAGNHPLIEELNQFYRKSEMLYFDPEGKIVVRDFGGKDKKSYGAGTGALQVIQNPWNPRGSFACGGAVWAVTGTDAEGVGLAAGVLLEQPQALKNAFALVVQKGKAIRAPIGPQGEKTIPLREQNGGGQSGVQGTGSQPGVSGNGGRTNEEEGSKTPGADGQNRDQTAGRNGDQNGESEPVTGETGAAGSDSGGADTAGSDTAGSDTTGADTAGAGAAGETGTRASAGGNYWWMALAVLAAGGISALLLRRRDG
jgi:hypothetical protein